MGITLVHDISFHWSKIWKKIWKSADEESEKKKKKKKKNTIKNAASYFSGGALKLFSQFAEIQLTLRANFMTSLSSHVLWCQGCTSTRFKMSEPVTIIMG